MADSTMGPKEVALLLGEIFRITSLLTSAAKRAVLEINGSTCGHLVLNAPNCLIWSDLGGLGLVTICMGDLT